MNKTERNKILRALLIPFIITVIFWIVWLIDRTEHLQLYKFGTYPRELFGLRGIIFTPFLHSTDDYAHIVNNSFPFLFLGWALYYFYQEIASRILLLIWAITGFWVWVAGNEAYHIGISGILYGLVTFLFYSGIVRKNNHLMGLTLLVTFFYGGMVWGVLPYDISISWESHLFGAVAGIILAWYFRKEGPAPDYKEWPQEVEPPFLLTPEGEKDYDYWKTEEQRKQSESESENERESESERENENENENKQQNSETQINYIYKKN